jgi:hypothetical protein
MQQRLVPISTLSDLYGERILRKRLWIGFLRACSKRHGSLGVRPFPATSFFLQFVNVGLRIRWQNGSSRLHEDDRCSVSVQHAFIASRPCGTDLGPSGEIAGICVAGLISFAAISTAAVAEFSAKDGQVLGRTLGFVGNGVSGVVVVGVVVSSADPASRRDAEAIRGVIGTDLPAGRVRLQVRLVPVEQLNAVTGVAALYVTSGLSASMENISGTAQRLHVPTISAELACVESRGCVVGFSTEPTVQIVIDSALAERMGVHFMQAFRMLVREK